MDENKPVPPEKWPHNFRDLPDNPTPWDVALMWISEGLTEWGHDTADPEAILRAAILTREAHCPYDCDHCHDSTTDIEGGGCSCRNCRYDDPGVTPCPCVNCDGIERDR